MLSSDDIKKLKGIFTTKTEAKKEFAHVDKQFTRMIAVMATKNDIRQLSERMDGFGEDLSKVLVAVDRLSIPLEDLRLEYVAVSEQLSRHERWHHQVADKLGIRLKYD
jgi:hypothetical protein